jgi:eukaryotic-like serine/threonine-protein kinase
MHTAPARGRQLAGFELLRAIGQGASSTVYLARHLASQEVVALKVVALASGADRAAAVERFTAAAQAAAQLRHPHIVQVLGSGVEDQQGWMSMEPVPGTDLSRYTRAPRLLPEPTVLHIAACLAEALTYAHANGIVHRDLKPANVLVNWADGTVKLGDFGLARLKDAVDTGTGVVMGSPAYMAPEQLAGAVPNAASDFYALGVVLFELLTGRRPHDSQALGELLRQVAREAAPDLRTLRPDMPDALAQMLSQLLAKSPTQRPADGLALSAELGRLGVLLGASGAKSR